MRIGVDFDNTIVNFDPLFHSAALQQKLIPKRAHVSKNGVRNYLQSRGRNDLWTSLQGQVYGRLIVRARPYASAKTFFSKAMRKGHQIFIVSHKTKKAAAPPHHDLHTPAKRWLKAQGFVTKAGLKPTQVFFETSMARKLARLRKLRCDVVIDDLYEFLARPDFPRNVRRILFDPNHHHSNISMEQVSSWTDASRRLLST